MEAVQNIKLEKQENFSSVISNKMSLHAETYFFVTFFRKKLQSEASKMG